MSFVSPYRCPKCNLFLLPKGYYHFQCFQCGIIFRVFKNPDSSTLTLTEETNDKNH